jgi:PAS domain S-box-containing protein
MDFDLDRLLREFMADAGDAIIVADRENTIRYWNQGATDIFGYAAEDAEGTSINIIIPKRLQERHREAFDRAMETGEFTYGRGDLLAVPARRKDGEEISVEFTVTPLSDGDDVVAIGAIIRDVTEQWEEKQEREARIEELEERIKTLRKDS